MTYEEAIKKTKQFGLYHAINDLPNSVLTVQAFNMAIEALEKQIPKKPIIFISDRYDYPEEAYRCSICDSNGDLYKGEYLYKGQRYCDECGNAVDWSDVE